MANVNLLPWRAVVKAKSQRNYIRLLIALTLMCLALLVISRVIVSERIFQQTQRNTYLIEKIQGVDATLSQLKSIRLRKQEIINRLQFVQRLQYERHLPAQILDELARVTPSDVVLVHMEKRSEQLLIQGESKSTGSVSDMIHRIQASQRFYDGSIKDIISKKQRPEYQGFRLRVSVDSDGNKQAEILSEI